MNRTKRITLCGISAALAAALMLVSYFPYLTYAVPAVAGLFIMVPVFEIGCKWATGTYLVSLVPVLLLAEPEAKLLYALIFGYYPILKAATEHIPFFLRWIVRLAAANGAIAVVYLVFAPLLGIPTDEFGQYGKIGVIALWAAANVVFVVYDIAVARISVVYSVRIRPKIMKYF